MTSWVKNNSGLVLLAVMLMLLAVFYPVYFMADDWEHLNWYHQGLPPYNLLREVYRVPAWVLLHGSLFPIFAENLFWLGKLISWSCVLTAAHIALGIFAPNWRAGWKSNWKYPFLLLFISFPINLYEWNFWPTNMCVTPALLLAVLCFKLHLDRPDRWFFCLLKYLAYAFAFFSYESLLLFCVLLEVAYVFYCESWSDFSRQVLLGIKRTLPFFVFAIVLKVVLDQLQPFEYGAEIGFKPHLFYQWLSLTFSHDYYKVRHATGVLFSLSLLGMVVRRFLVSREDFLKRDLFLFFMYVMASSYYFVIMDYSARRALGGQIYFYWFFITVLALWNLRTELRFRKLGKISAWIFIASSLIHQGYVFTQKKNEYDTISANSQALIKEVDGLSSPKAFSIDQPRQGLGRAWNFIGIRQLNGYLRHYLNEEQRKKVIFGWDGFEKGPYSEETKKN